MLTMSTSPETLCMTALSAVEGYLASDHRSEVGGKSGGVLNKDLVRELEEVALEHVRKNHTTSKRNNSTQSWLK